MNALIVAGRLAEPAQAAALERGMRRGGAVTVRHGDVAAAAAAAGYGAAFLLGWPTEPGFSATLGGRPVQVTTLLCYALGEQGVPVIGIAGEEDLRHRSRPELPRIPYASVYRIPAARALRVLEQGVFMAMRHLDQYAPCLPPPGEVAVALPGEAPQTVGASPLAALPVLARLLA